jgi:hypothetical protein
MSASESYEDINFEGIDDDLAAFQEDEMVQQALQRGVDLKKYGGDLGNDLKKAELASVDHYIQHYDLYRGQYQELQECDRVLARMEEMLHGFQADLGEISSEIKHLQEASISMSIKLKNRRNVAEKLHAFLEKTNIPPSVLNHINSPHVHEGFLDAVVTLGKRLNYLEQHKPPSDGSSLDVAPADTSCGRGLLPELEKLKIKAIGKIRDYFTNQFNGIRKPKTNICMLQQTALVKYAPLFHFLTAEQSMVADELRGLYVESMGRTVQNLFKSYYAQMSKLELPTATKNDLLIVEEATIKSMFTQKIDMTKRGDAFSLGDRSKTLEQIEREPILVHLAIADNQKVYYEEIFRSTLKHLVDAATNEFLFIVDFFRTSPKDTFNRIYGKTIQGLLENFENYLVACHDVVGLLILIRMTHLLRLVMQRRRLPILDPLFDRISMLLWPRFKQLLDANVKSLKNVSLLRRTSAQDLSPHYVTRRYAEFVSSIVILNIVTASTSQHQHLQQAQQDLLATLSAAGVQDASGMMVGMELDATGGGELMIRQDIHVLRNELVALLERSTSQISTYKEQRVYLINNFDQVLSIFQERGLLSEEVQCFETFLMQQRELFAEEEIKTFFPRLVSFVLQTEQVYTDAVASGTSEPMRMSIDERACEALVRDFSANWRAGIQQINDDVLKYFANFRNGMEILKQVLTQLLLYYTRFQDLIKKSFGRPPAFVRDIVSNATILMEIKRYSRTF